MIIGYARVSTTDQNTALQTDALTTAGAERIYEESQSGASRDRSELIRCIDTLRQGDTLIVWRLDRLGRSLKDLVAIIAELEGKGVGFRSITEAIDTTTAGGKLVFHIFGSLAEFERSMIQERTKAGLAAARARGRKGGRPRALTEQQAKKAHAMLRDPTITKTEVAKHFNVTRATLNTSLKRVL